MPQPRPPLCLLPRPRLGGWGRLIRLPGDAAPRLIKRAQREKKGRRSENFHKAEIAPVSLLKEARIVPLGFWGTGRDRPFGFSGTNRRLSSLVLLKEAKIVPFFDEELNSLCGDEGVMPPVRDSGLPRSSGKKAKICGRGQGMQWPSWRTATPASQ